MIHGSGVVRAGQWARRLIISDDLASGSQIPFIVKAIEMGFGVIVMNTNQTEEDAMNISASTHAEIVWENHIQSSNASVRLNW